MPGKIGRNQEICLRVLIVLLLLLHLFKYTQKKICILGKNIVFDFLGFLVIRFQDFSYTSTKF